MQIREQQKTARSIGMKICHLTSMHDWDDDRIFQRACVGLAREGHNVILIATYKGSDIIDGVKIIGIHQRM